MLSWALVTALLAASAPPGPSASLEVEGVRVEAEPLLPAVRRLGVVPIELRATGAGGGMPARSRVTVKLCPSTECDRWRRVDLKVGTEAEPAPAVVARLSVPYSTFHLAPWSEGQLGPRPTVSRTKPLGYLNSFAGRRVAAIVGTFEEAVPAAGWMDHQGRHYGEGEGGVAAVPVGSTLAAHPDLVHAYDAVLLAPGAEVPPVLRTELLRYLRAGGRLVAPASVAESYLPRVDAQADPEAVLDGEAPLRPTLRPLRMRDAPALVVDGRQVLREPTARLQLPVKAAPVESGWLLAYDGAATGADLVDALLVTSPRWALPAYGTSDLNPAGWPTTVAASVQLARVPSMGWLSLALLLWCVVVVVVVRRSAARGPRVALGRAAAVTAGLTALVVVSAQLARGPAEEARFRLVVAAPGATWGLERGTTLHRLGSEEAITAQVPAGAFAQPLITGKDRYGPRPLERPAPTTVRLLSGPDAPAGAGWLRPVPVEPGLRLVDDPGGGWSVVNEGKAAYDEVVVYRNGAPLWASGPLGAGERRAGGDLVESYELEQDGPADQRDAARRRFVREVVSWCRSVPGDVRASPPARPRCALGLRQTDEGLVGELWQERAAEGATEGAEETSP